MKKFLELKINSIFSKRITNEKEQTVVGSTNYIPVCRSCYETN
jgi:hypothetical protein